MQLATSTSGYRSGKSTNYILGEEVTQANRSIESSDVKGASGAYNCFRANGGLECLKRSDETPLFTMQAGEGLFPCRFSLFFWASARIEEKLERRGLRGRRSAMGELHIIFSSFSLSHPEFDSE